MRCNELLLNEKLELFKIGIKNKKIAVLGIGRSNIPAIQFLHKLGANLSVRDKNKNALEKCPELLKLDVELLLGENYLVGLDKFDYILRTPGIKPFLPEIEEATKKGAKLTSEIELVIDLAPCKVIGVTGSDGKTTTTTIISKFLEKEGYKVWLGGNIGKSVFAEIEKMDRKDVVVLELSSFQLMNLRKSPNISVITNISPNHLDYHRSFEEYVFAKANIFFKQGRNDLLVLNSDDKYTEKYLNVIKENKIQNEIRMFSLGKKVEKGAYLKNNEIVYCDKDKETTICKKSDVKLVGMHNIANICTAVSACFDLVSLESMKDVISNFSGVEHRMEFVREISGVSFYNDSIASSPTRTIAGLKSFKNKVILIAGGYDKNIPYDEIGKYIIDKVKLLLLVGATSKKIKDAVLNEASKEKIEVEEILDIQEFENLKDALDYALMHSKVGDNVVMSPASASFDMYKDFEERGNYFKELVNEL